MSDYGYSRSGLYRSRDGIIAGVCAGLAEYLDLSLFWVRVVAVALLLCSGFWPVGALYLIAALMMKKAPRVYWE